MSIAAFEIRAERNRAFSGRRFSWATLGFLTLSPFHRLQVLYVGFWFIYPCYAHSARQWWLLLLAFLVFLPFFTALHQGQRQAVRVVGLVGLLLLALVYVPYNLSAFGIYIFIATALNHIGSSARAFVRLLGGLCAFIVAQALIFHSPTWEILSAVGACVIGGVTVFLQCQTRKADARLRMAHDEIEQLAKTAERERIARDLHDVLGHTLSLITVKSELAARLLASDPQRTAQELAEIQTTARRALAEVRQTVSGYRTQGLEAEIQQATVALAASGVTVTSRPEHVPRLPAQQEASLALILREAVTNIVRHAGARTCAITLQAGPAEIVFEIRDDGRGLAGEEGNGVLGMRERVRELGGALELRSSAGTVLRLVLPAVLPGVLPGPQSTLKSAEPTPARLEPFVSLVS